MPSATFKAFLFALVCLSLTSCARNGSNAIIETVEVLVAVDDMPIGTFLNEPEKQLQLRTVAKTSAPADAIRSLDEVRQRYLRVPRAVGEPLRKMDFEIVEQRIVPGYWLCTIPLTMDGHQVFIFPGMRFVVLTIEERDGRAVIRELTYDAIVMVREEKAKGDVTVMVTDTVASVIRSFRQVKNGRFGIIPKRDDDDKIIDTSTGTRGP